MIIFEENFDNEFGKIYASFLKSLSNTTFWVPRAPPATPTFTPYRHGHSYRKAQLLVRGKPAASPLQQNGLEIPPEDDIDQHANGFTSDQEEMFTFSEDEFKNVSGNPFCFSGYQLEMYADDCSVAQIFSSIFDEAEAPEDTA